MIYSNPTSRAVWDGFSEAEKAAGLKVYAALVEELAAHVADAFPRVPRGPYGPRS